MNLMSTAVASWSSEADGMNAGQLKDNIVPYQLLSEKI